MDRTLNVSKIRITKKLMAAAAILSNEQYIDASEQAVLAVALARGVKAEQFYRALQHFGYRWNGRHWYRVMPRWLLAVREDRRLYEVDDD